MHTLAAIFVTAFAVLLWAVFSAAHHVRRARHDHAMEDVSPAAMASATPVFRDAALKPAGRPQRPLETFF